MKILLILSLFICIQSFAIDLNGDSLYLVENYTKTEVQITMRDGVKLFTIIYSPKDETKKYPILLNRTPYSIAPYDTVMGFQFRRGLFPQFLREGFIFVFQDVRGRFMSEGKFQHMTPFIANKKSNYDVDESSDAYDTMEWLNNNIKNSNGRVGMWGISYPGFYTSCAAINAHPTLKCVSPQAPIADWFFDDVYHHGAFFLSSMFSFIAAMDIPQKQPYKDWMKSYNKNTSDGYNFYKNLEPLSKVKTNYFGDSIAFWNEIIAHPNYDCFWKERNILPNLKNIKPAVLVVGGWYDAEDLYGTFKTYQSIEKQSPGNDNRIVIGPWFHGGWARADGDYLGNVWFEQKTSLFYRDSIELPFFNYYLKDKGEYNIAEATMFVTGENQWRSFKQWPPENVANKKLYFHENGKLSFKPVQKTEQEYDEFISDPSKPIPDTEAIYMGMTKEYMTDDQRFAARRPDVLVFETNTLTENITMAGPIMARLKVSTSHTDADWIVKLIDVYPSDATNNPHTLIGKHMSDYQQMVRSEVIRGRFRKSYEKPEPFSPGLVEEVNLQMQDVLHCFKKGHKVMVQIQSSWFPMVDLNPQNYVDNIFYAETSDFVKASHRVYHSSDDSSFIEFGVIEY